MEKKNIKIIPKGLYCYSIDMDNIDDYNVPGKGIPVFYCPYYKSKIVEGIDLPWCDFLNLGGVSNSTTDEEYEKLVNHFGSEKNLEKDFPLDLLWDAVKECDENKEYK